MEQPADRTHPVPIFSVATGRTEMVEMVVHTDAEWQRLLTEDQFRVARKKGTEPAGTGIYAHCDAKGIYTCVCCGTDLFSSETKFESGTGWPSFSAPVAETNMHRVRDSSLGMERTEVLCSRCNAHLGHVFDDGPAPTHQRYCMNSASLRLVRED
jgi:peptide-methionine (R)-S-oxide reductase